VNRDPGLCLATLVAVACVSCAPPSAPPPSPPPPTSSTAAVAAAPTAAMALAASGPLGQAQRASQQFQERLKAALMAAIEQGGPAAAIEVCAASAPAIARELSTGGLTVGRTSARLRNPTNAPPPWLAAQLATWATQPAASRKPTSLTLPGGAVAFAAPISMQPVCATCHGAAVADDVKAAIAARYPNDAAIGFGPDELRGAVWATVAP
jgi:hypothetical protein